MSKYIPGKRRKCEFIVPLRTHEYIVVLDEAKLSDRQKVYLAPMMRTPFIVTKERRDKYFIRVDNGQPYGWRDKKWFRKPSTLEVLMYYTYIYPGKNNK